MNFFQDENGDYSYGRLASFTCVLQAGVLAFMGEDPYNFLGAAVTFYLISKGKDAAVTIWGNKGGANV